VTSDIEGIQTVSYPISSLLITSDGSIVAGDERGSITSIRLATEKQTWRFKSGGEISSLLEIGRGVLAASHDNFVYFLASGSGGVMWKRRLAGRMVQVARIADEYVLLSSLDDTGAVLLALDDGRVVGRLALGDDEKLAAQPLSSDGTISVVTNVAAYGYSTSGCPGNNEGGAARK
jgi:outer membrane protein assembly factor BamB